MFLEVFARSKFHVPLLYPFLSEASRRSYRWESIPSDSAVIPFWPAFVLSTASARHSTLNYTINLLPKIRLAKWDHGGCSDSSIQRKGERKCSLTRANWRLEGPSFRLFRDHNFPLINSHIAIYFPIDLIINRLRRVSHQSGLALFTV